MANWYQKEKNVNVSKYRANLEALIVVPSNQNKEEEKNVANFVLNKFLPEGNDASPRTAIDSTVNIEIGDIREDA